MIIEISKEQMEEFLIDVIVLEKNFAHEQRNVKNDRRAELKAKINAFAARELDREIAENQTD